MQKTFQFSDTVDRKIAKASKIAIVRTDYHAELNDNLEAYCRKTLIHYGVLEKNIKTFIAPGSWEIPLISQKVAQLKKFDGIITFGVIVKGDTYHFDMIAHECSRALMQLSLDYSIPVALEVLAVFDIADARVRAGNNNQNKGIEGATAVLKTLSTLKKIPN